MKPPIAPRRPSRRTLHGITVTDDYAWLKDEKWQEVLRDPSLLDPDIRAYLESENAYAEALLAPTQALQKTLVAEMRGRIKEDDSGVPTADGPFAYLWKFRDGGQHQLIGRTPRGGGDVQIVLDGDALAKASDYFKFGGTRHSPDHRLEAWSADLRGSEFFTIRIRRWDTGEDLPDVLTETGGGVVWGLDSTFFYYVHVDDNHRPLKVYRHRLGTAQADDVLVYEEKDIGWFTHIEESAGRRFCIVGGGADKGWSWYLDGKREKKTNTFDDFAAAGRALIDQRYTAAKRIVGHGGSAGGMLMGAVANRAGELFVGIVAEVPFVDVLATMLDDKLPLTPPEWPEWGNPITDEAAFRYILSYSPYDNVAARDYPAILAMAGLTDPRVTYWEPAKWIARLRATMTSGGPVLLRTNMGAGHGGSSGRFSRLDEVAIAYAFALQVVGKAG